MQQAGWKLKQILEEQAELVAELIAIGRAETAALRANDLEALLALLPHQEACLARVQALDAGRRTVEEELQGEAALPETGPPSGAAGKVAGPENELLAALAERLLSGFLELRELSATNRLLIRQSLRFIDAELARLGPGEAVYDRQGRVGRAAPKAMDRIV